MTDKFEELKRELSAPTKLDTIIVEGLKSYDVKIKKLEEEKKAKEVIVNTLKKYAGLRKMANDSINYADNCDPRDILGIYGNVFKARKAMAIGYNSLISDPMTIETDAGDVPINEETLKFLSDAIEYLDQCMLSWSLHPEIGRAHV